ncbi:collagen triple helix repeat-containing protein 1-like [Acropora millepora]|uniref:collagen triple helix repeat-containing protein 1-like n=1 Tax=Acropora millepora TaxID=45264 RepID=UPI001CF3B63E|nr:collagen triple helix repeat-containing protein 1-like [Acropora millepora]
MGPEGPKGTLGDKGEQGARGPKGELRNWKQYAWEDINDGKDNGLIKECTFNKNASNTVLKVEFNGDYRVAGCSDCCRRWFFTFDGSECRPAIDGIAYIGANNGQRVNNRHKTTYIGGYCEGIANGTVRVGLNVGNCVDKNTPDSNAYTGWGSVTRIMIEEVAPSVQ